MDHIKHTEKKRQLCQCITKSTGRPCQNPPSKKKGNNPLFCHLHQGCTQLVGGPSSSALPGQKRQSPQLPQKHQSHQNKQQKETHQISELGNVMDDAVIESICQAYAQAGDFKSLASMIRSSKRAQPICQRILDLAVQAKEKSNPVDIPIRLEAETKPELIKGDKEEYDQEYYDSTTHWQMGVDVDWSTIINPDRILLGGKGPFTIMVPTCDEEEEREMGAHSIVMKGQVTLRKVVDTINAYVKQCDAMTHDQYRGWLDDHTYPEGLIQDRENKHIYHLDLD